MHVLDPASVQSLILRSHTVPYSRHLFFRFGDGNGARSFLAGLLPRIAHGATDPAADSGALLNLSISWGGLLKLGVFDRLGGVEAAGLAFPADFRVPPDAAATAAYGPSAPRNWWKGRFQTADIDLSLHIYAANQEDLEKASADAGVSAGRCDVEELSPTGTGAAIEGTALGAGVPGLRRLHFGYSDGFSQPPVNWNADPAMMNAYPRHHFIIDDWDDEAQSFPRYEPWRGLVRHSSYLALTWVYQDVAAFNRFLRDNAQKIARPGMTQPEAEEYLAAKLLGRWRDGTPLALSPNHPDSSLATAEFGYKQDPLGVRCPVSAHVRITNGRDQSLDFVNRMMFPAGFPRVIRRGSSYGPWLEGTEDDGVDRGILGMFLCANAKQQFFSLMRWIGTTNFSEAFPDQHGQDALFASRDVPDASRSFSIPTERGVVTIDGLPQFIRLQGVAVMLLPSMSTLNRLASSA